MQQKEIVPIRLYYYRGNYMQKERNLKMIVIVIDVQYVKDLLMLEPNIVDNVTDVAMNLIIIAIGLITVLEKLIIEYLLH